MKSLMLTVCLLAGILATSCKDSTIYPKVPYSTTLDQVEAVTTDLRLPADHPLREKIEILKAGMICVEPEVHNTLVDVALTCEKDLKKLQKTCKP